MLPGLTRALMGIGSGFVYVGSNITSAAATGDTSLSLTSLSGGSDSSARSGDLVIAFYANVVGGGYTLSIKDPSDVEYPNLYGTQLIAGSGTVAQMRVASKIITSDTTVVFKYPGFSTDHKACGVMVLRQASSTLDAAATTYTGSGELPNPASISSVTSGAIIACVGASGDNSVTGYSFTAPSGLSDFRETVFGSGGREIRLGFGYSLASTFDCPAFGLSGTPDGRGGAVAMSLALRPAS